MGGGGLLIEQVILYIQLIYIYTSCSVEFPSSWTKICSEKNYKNDYSENNKPLNVENFFSYNKCKRTRVYGINPSSLLCFDCIRLSLFPFSFCNSISSFTYFVELKKKNRDFQIPTLLVLKLTSESKNRRFWYFTET